MSSHSSDRITFTYYDKDGDAIAKLSQDDKNIIVTFDPKDAQKAEETILKILPKSSLIEEKKFEIEEYPVNPKDGGIEKKVRYETKQLKHLNAVSGFARIKTNPGANFSDMFQELVSSPVFTGVIPAVKEDLKTGPGMIRYFLPARLFVKVKEQFLNDAENIIDNYKLKIVRNYGVGWYSVSPKEFGDPNSLESLFAQYEKYRSTGKSEFDIVDLHEVCFDTALLTPNDSYFSQQWAIKAAVGNQHISAEQAWSLSTGNLAHVYVAILDTGIDTNHPELSGNIQQRFNPVNNGTTNADVEDSDGHGTFVSGIVGAVTNNGPGGQIAGVSWNCGLFVIKIDDDLVNLDLGYVVESIQKVKNEANSNSTATGIRYVMNISWGCSNNTSVHDEITNAYNAGVVIVAAAGDSAPGQPGNDISSGGTWPAAWPEVLAASAHKNQANAPKTTESNYGTNCIIAPGNSCISTIINNGTPQGKTGTSIAAPHVAGVAALCWAKTYKTRSQFPGTPANDRSNVYNSIISGLVSWSGGVSMRGRLNANNAVSRMP